LTLLNNSLEELTERIISYPMESAFGLKFSLKNIMNFVYLLLFWLYNREQKKRSKEKKKNWINTPK